MTVVLMFRIENIYRALESKLWVFGGSGSNLCSWQFRLFLGGEGTVTVDIFHSDKSHFKCIAVVSR